MKSHELYLLPQLYHKPSIRPEWLTTFSFSLDLPY